MELANHLARLHDMPVRDARHLGHGLMAHLIAEEMSLGDMMTLLKLRKG